ALHISWHPHPECGRAYGAADHAADAGWWGKEGGWGQAQTVREETESDIWPDYYVGLIARAPSQGSNPWPTQVMALGVSPRCKNCRTSFGFCRGLLQTDICPLRHKRPFVAESRSAAQVITGLHRFRVSSRPKTRNHHLSAGIVI